MATPPQPLTKISTLPSGLIVASVRVARPARALRAARQRWVVVHRASERTAVLTSSLSPSLSRLPTCIFHGLQESQPHAQTATVGVYFDVGSRHDHKAGVAHFAEHVVSRPPAPLWRSSFLVAC